MERDQTDRIPVRTTQRNSSNRSDQTPYRALVTCGVFEPGFRGGGPVRSVAQILDSAPENVELILITRDRDLGSSTPYDGLSGKWISRGRSRIYYLNPRSMGQWTRLFRALHRTRFDLIYANSLWSPITTIIPIIASRLKLIKSKAILVAPRGELAPGALSLKSNKKRIITKPWGHILRSLGATFHATADHEADDIRKTFPWAKVRLHPDQNGLPDEPLSPTESATDHPRLVFVSRIAPVKNLVTALQALRKVTGNIDFDLYGPIEDRGYWATCQDIIKTLPSNVRVKYRGELQPNRVRETFREYEAFVFPTKGENFGHVIAESLSASCPVICTPWTPWTGVLQEGGGTVLNGPLLESLAHTLQRYSLTTIDERFEARLEAGIAYRKWKKSRTERNIFEVLTAAPEGR